MRAILSNEQKVTLYLANRAESIVPLVAPIYKDGMKTDLSSFKRRPMLIHDQGGLQMHTYVLRPVTAAIIAASTCSAVHAAAINNGGFESPKVPDGRYTNFDTASNLTITDWTVVGTQASIVSGALAVGSMTFPAQEGSQWLDLTGYLTNSRDNGVTQTMATIPGTKYTLSFWVGNIVDPGGSYGKTSTVEVSINGGERTQFTNADGAGTTVMNWKQFTASFAANSASTTITFFNGDPADDNSNGLDNVVILP